MLLTGSKFELFDQYGADWEKLSGALSTRKKQRPVAQLDEWISKIILSPCLPILTFIQSQFLHRFQY